MGNNYLLFFEDEVLLSFPSFKEFLFGDAYALLSTAIKTKVRALGSSKSASEVCYLYMYALYVN